MVVSISYKEAEQIIFSHFHRNVALKHGENSQLNIATTIRVFGLEKNIGMNISVEKIEGTNLFIVYNGKMGVDLIVNPIISFLKKLLPEKVGFIMKHTANGIVINLYEIDKLQPVLEKVELQGISFEESCLCIETALKL